MTIDRRKFLLKSAFGVGSLQMQSLITGLPLPFLLGLSQTTRAQDLQPFLKDPKFLMLSISGAGEAINSNAPGTYVEPGNASTGWRKDLIHPNTPDFAATQFSLGQQQVTAAHMWSTLPADLRSRMAFWHHGTYVSAHPEYPKVLIFHGNVKNLALNGIEQFPTMIAESTADSLSTVVKEVVPVGGQGVLSRQGKGIPVLNPLEVKTLFGNPNQKMEQMIKLRDKAVDRIYKDTKFSGDPAAMKFFDRYATSRSEAAVMGDQLGALITTVASNEAVDQIKVAVAMIKLSIAPITALSIRFSGDNHKDADLNKEIRESAGGIENLKQLWAEMKAAGIQDKTVFCNLDAFGRTNGKGDGRGHNGNHHAMMVFGPNIKPGEIGNTEAAFHSKSNTNNTKATGINSTNGSSTKADIPFDETLAAVGKTICKAVGMEEDTINTRIVGGKIIRAALTI